MSDSDSSVEHRKKSRLVKKKDLEEFRNQRDSAKAVEQQEAPQPKAAARHLFASDADALAAQLFGDAGEGRVVNAEPVEEERVAVAQRPRSPSSLSGDSLDDFIYRDTRAPADDLGSEGGSEYDEDILADIRDVFGDLRVLQLRDVARPKPKTPSTQPPAIEADESASREEVEGGLDGSAEDEASFPAESLWLWASLAVDSPDKALWIRACTMFLRDWLIRGFGLHFIKRHLVSAKYATVLSDRHMEEIVRRLHAEWRELAVWHRKLHDGLKKTKDMIENAGYEMQSSAMGVVDVLEISRSVSYWSSVLEISFSDPGSDFRSVLLCVQSGVANYLEPIRRALFPEATAELGASRTKLRRRDSAGAGVLGEMFKDTEGASEQLVQLFSLMNCRPSDLGRICVGQLGLSSRGGYFNGAGVSQTTIHAVALLLSSDFAFRMYVRHELTRRASVYVVPLKPITMADPQYVHRRVLARPLVSFSGSSDFLEYVELENRGDVKLCLAMTSGGVVAECKGPGVFVASPETVGKSTWACAQLHALKQADQAGRVPEQLADDHIRSCLVSDPIFSSIVQRLLSPHELNSDSDRGGVVQALIRQALSLVYTELYAEIKQDLTQRAESVVAIRASDALAAKIGKRGWMAENLPSGVLDDLGSRQREAVFRAMMGEFSVASVVQDPRGGIRVVFANNLGEQVASDSYTFLLDRQQGGADRRKNDEEQKLAESLAEFRVAVVALSADFEPFRVKQLTRVFEDIVRTCDDDFVKRVCKILVVDDVHVVGSLPEQRGLAVARFVQNPLAESLKLWTPEADRNVLLSITFHPLQHLIPRAKLHAYFQSSISRLVAKSGFLDVAKIARSPWRGTVLQFLPGMDSVKAQRLLKSRDFASRNDDHIHDSGSDSESDDVAGVKITKSRGWKGLKDLVDDITWKNIESFFPRIPDSSRAIAVLKDTRNNLKVLKQAMTEDSIEIGALVLTRAEFVACFAEDAVDLNNILMEVLGIPSDMWPLVSPLLQETTGSGDLQAAICSSQLRRHRSDLRAFVSDVVNSGDAPGYLRDAEIDSDLLQKNGAQYMKDFLVQTVVTPYRVTLDKFYGLTEEQIFELQLGPGGLGVFGFLRIHRLRIVKDDGRWSSLRFVDLSIDGSLKRSGPVWSVNDRVTGRIVDLESARQQAAISIDAPITAEMRELGRLAPDTLVLKGDMAVYQSLGRESAATGASRSTGSGSGPVRARRVIRHENYYAEIDHGMALVKLKGARIGEVVFRSSKSKSNLLMAMLKIKEPVDVVRQDWVKVFQFTEEPSSRNPNKMVFKLRLGGDGAKNEEYEELDQIKAVLIDRYLRYLSDFKQHNRFRPETLEQVRNLVNAEFMTDARGHVAYHFALDERMEFAGSGVLLWCAQGTKVKEEPISITHRGFRLWNKGPFPNLNQLISWWKTEGFAKRAAYLAEWQQSLSK